MKQLCEYLRGLRYKLRMMGIPCSGPVYIQGDNQLVLANTSIPDSVLKKKSQSLAYHFIREGCACGEWMTSYIHMSENTADLLTKTLPHGDKGRILLGVCFIIFLGMMDEESGVNKYVEPLEIFVFLFCWTLVNIVSGGLMMRSGTTRIFVFVYVGYECQHLGMVNY